MAVVPVLFQCCPKCTVPCKNNKHFCLFQKRMSWIVTGKTADHAVDRAVTVYFPDVALRLVPRDK